MIDKTHSAGMRREISTAHTPLAVIRAYRKTGCVIVIVERTGRAPHRHRISLHRYAALREWTITKAPRQWRTSGAWLRGSITVCFWSAL